MISVGFCAPLTEDVCTAALPETKGKHKAHDQNNTETQLRHATAVRVSAFRITIMFELNEQVR